jgi:hypothetical protein
MSVTLRAAAVASAAALVVATGVTAAGATGSAAPSGHSADAFHVHPSFGPVGTTLTLTGADFSTDTGVTIHGVAATDYTAVSSDKVTAVVPHGAASGHVAVTDGVTSVKGPSFVLQAATTTHSSASKKKLKFSHSVLIKAHEDVKTTGAPVVGEDAVLQHRASTSKGWHRAKGEHVKPTHGAGGVKWRVAPSADSSYRVYFRQSHEALGATTAKHSVKVAPRIHLRSLHTVTELTTSKIRGSVHPHLSGRVYLQKRSHGHWKNAHHQGAKGGKFSFDISPSSLKTLKYRIVRHSDSRHAHANSRTLHVHVVNRTLSFGASGDDVLTLQKRLHKLHYDIGSRNGSYGWDTVHAVTAFEKVNKLAKDGEAGPAVWSALNDPKKVHLRYPYPDDHLAVEVNLKKQVLILAKNGHVWRILDTSTAGGYYYTNSEGQTEKAVTPRGHFTIQYKLEGYHKSDLGELYYPSYFTDTGYAIHGEGNTNAGSDVPPYPNSHGCVRITNNAVLRYYDKLVVGTSVWIYQ